MAVTDDLGMPPPAGFERQPPQDVQAEQSVLGGMLLSKDAIADVVEVLRSTDFYRPAHQAIYDTILDLYGRGEPADPVTVSAELTRTGQLMRVGGSPYLHTLISSVPTAANAGFYAEIVAERAVLRRLVEAGTRIVQLGYGAASGQGGEVDEVVDRAQAEIYDVTGRRMSEDYVRLEQLLQGTMDEIDAIASRGGAGVGVPTGFAELDERTHGLHAGQMIVIAARPAVGKALALDTPLPTPTGWTTMGEVCVGDELIGADGRPTTVIAATSVMHGRRCYEVEFSDGAVIVADGQHQWKTTVRAGRRACGAGRPAGHYWTPGGLGRGASAAACVAAQPDRLVAVRESVEEVGPEFRGVLLTVGRGTGDAGRRWTAGGGPRRRHSRRTPAYSRRDMMPTRLERVVRPAGDWCAAARDSIVTTEEIAATLWPSSGVDRRRNHAVAVAAPLQLADRDLPLAPYVLGAWLGGGDGHSAGYTCADPEILDNIRAEGYRITRRNATLKYQIRLPEPAPVAARRCAVCGAPFVPGTSQLRTCGRACGGTAGTGSASVPAPRCPDCGRPSSGSRLCRACRNDHGSVPAILRSLGVLGNKHIPAAYLRASEAQRRALLAGLLDTEGTVAKSGSVQFAVMNARLAEDILELILSLGYRATMRRKPVESRPAESSTCHMIDFTPPEPVSRLPSKAVRCATSTRSTEVRHITAVRRIPSVPVRCIEVDNADHLYLAGRSMIPTHNSTLALDVARSCSIRNGLASVIFSLEMSKSEITMRLLSAEAKVPLHHMRSGHMSDDDWARLARRMGEVADAPLYVDDSPNLTMMEIRAKARRLRQRHDLRLVVVDYLQLMTSGKRVESRQQEVSEFSRSLKLLAKELEVPVIAISQLNRSPEQRQDKKPMLADLRECLAGDTLIVRADTGERVPISELAGLRDVPVWTLDERLRLRRGVMAEVWRTGVRPVQRLTLASGRQITATANHPLLTVHGWTPVEALRVGDHIATARAAPGPEPRGWWSDDVVPADVWDYVRKAMRAAGIGTRALAERIGVSYRGGALHRSGLSRERLARVAAAVPDPYLASLATSDVRWDRIMSIEPAGEDDVFDARVPGTHSFLANDVVSHNSGAIEQDSDLVILLHREDIYERESPRAGEADLILAKHRNGPTGTVTVAFQGHYSRFVDMAT